jgi:hypothetical protein
LNNYENSSAGKPQIHSFNIGKDEKPFTIPKGKNIKRPLVYADIVSCKKIRIACNVVKCETNTEKIIFSPETRKSNSKCSNTSPKSQVDKTKILTKDQEDFASMNHEKAKELRKSLRDSVLKRRKYRLRNSSNDEDIEVEIDPGKNVAQNLPNDSELKILHTDESDCCSHKIPFSTSTDVELGKFVEIIKRRRSIAEKNTKAFIKTLSLAWQEYTRSKEIYKDTKTLVFNHHVVPDLKCFQVQLYIYSIHLNNKCYVVT